jgi:protein transport protein SEC13
MSKNNVIASVETGHMDSIHDCQLDYYGKRLATASSDRLVKLFDVVKTQTADGSVTTEIKHRFDLQGHDGPVWAVAWSHPKFGSIIASCGYDSKVCLHQEVSAENWQLVYEYAGFESSVNSIAWAPNEYGLILGCVSSNGMIALLTLRDTNDLTSWDVNVTQDSALGVNAISFAPYGALGSTTFMNTGDQEYTASIRRFAIASSDNTVKIYKIDDAISPYEPKHETTLNHNESVRDVAWAPSLGLPINTVASCSEDGVVKIWKQEDEGGPWKETNLPKFDKPVWRLSWSITGNILAVSSGEAEVTLWKESLDKTWVQVTNVSESIKETSAVTATELQNSDSQEQEATKNVAENIIQNDNQPVKDVQDQGYDQQFNNQQPQENNDYNQQQQQPEAVNEYDQQQPPAVNEYDQQQYGNEFNQQPSVNEFEQQQYGNNEFNQQPPVQDFNQQQAPPQDFNQPPPQDQQYGQQQFGQPPQYGQMGQDFGDFNQQGAPPPMQQNVPPPANNMQQYNNQQQFPPQQGGFSQGGYQPY